MGTGLWRVAAGKGRAWIGDIAITFDNAGDRAGADDTLVQHLETIAQRIARFADPAVGIGAVGKINRILEGVDIPAADLDYLSERGLCTHYEKPTKSICMPNPRGSPWAKVNGCSSSPHVNPDISWWNSAKIWGRGVG